MVRLIIPRNVSNIIKEWCRQLPDNEWSGALFYKVKSGTIQDNLVLEAVDILVQDIGSSVFTEYTPSPEILTYQDENDLLDCYVGLVH